MAVLFMEIKPATTYSQQIEKIKERGCNIQDEDFAEMVLSQLNYYRFTAYFLPFRKDDGTYIEGTDFERVYQIYEFDREMRLLLLGALEQIEIFMRSQLAYYHGHAYGPMGYMDRKNFNSKHQHDKFLKNFNREIENNRNSKIVKHHKFKYGGNFPVWAAVELFSFGMTSKFFSDMKRRDRINLANQTIFSDEEKVQSWLKCCTDLRNICAHYGRLYFRNFPSIPAAPQEGDPPMGMSLFDEIIAAKMLYPDSDTWNSVVLAGIESLIDKYENAIELNDIGFQEDWKNALTKDNRKSAKTTATKELITTAD